MNAFSTLAVTREALLSQPLQGSAWPQAMELAVPPPGAACFATCLYMPLNAAKCRYVPVKIISLPFRHRPAGGRLA